MNCEHRSDRALKIKQLLILTAGFVLIALLASSAMLRNIFCLACLFFAGLVIVTGKSPRPVVQKFIKRYFPVFILALIFMMPDVAFASPGISEFTGPVDKVVNTITGPVGKAVAILGMAVCGFIFITQKEDMAGGAKSLLAVVFGICFIAFAAPIVNSVFSFSGAVI